MFPNDLGAFPNDVGTFPDDLGTFLDELGTSWNELGTSRTDLETLPSHSELLPSERFSLLREAVFLPGLFGDLSRDRAPVMPKPARSKGGTFKLAFRVKIALACTALTYVRACPQKKKAADVRSAAFWLGLGNVSPWYRSIRCDAEGGGGEAGGRAVEVPGAAAIDGLVVLAVAVVVAGDRNIADRTELRR